MAQLPPRFPCSIALNWPNFSGNQKNTPSMGPFFDAAGIDEFLGFSSARRGSHRRSVSDSVAFSEDNAHDFDRLDDDQLMSMFTCNEVPAGVTLSNPSMPFSHNSASEEKAAVTEKGRDLQNDSEAERDCKVELQAATTQTANADSLDTKRVKRILANRQSAQRSRVRKLHYISKLEFSVTTLQTEVSTLSPRVAFLDHQRSVLSVGNSHLKQRIAALAQDKIFKDAHQEALKNEIERLRQVYHQQSLKNIGPTSETCAMRVVDKEILS